MYRLSFFSARELDMSQHPASTEDVLFDMFRNEESDLLPIGMFLSVSNFQGPWILNYTDTILCQN
jgi:hypothetical protein